MSRISVNYTKTAATAGFTLVELIVGVTLSAIIFAGVLGGFTFLGRNLTRLVNAQELDAKSRRALYLLGQDINAATQLGSAANEKSIQLTVGSDAISYAFDDVALTLSRTAPAVDIPHAPTTTILLTNLKSLGFKFYNQAGNELALVSGHDVDLTKSGVQSVKEIELSFESALGNSASGTRTLFSGKSPRFALRNRPLLQ